MLLARSLLALGGRSIVIIEDEDKVIQVVRHWVESFVVGLNLCPFAKRELAKGSVHFVAATSTTNEQLLMVLQRELERLNAEPAIETTLVIHPDILQDFHDYNQFLGVADNLLVQMELEGVYQIASFHPAYQFGGTQPQDAENYTNRSPFPMLHLLREASLERAIADYPDVDQIPARNISLMNGLGQDKLKNINRSNIKSE